VTPAQIGKIGEHHVATWFQLNGYTVTLNARLPGSTDIEADGRAAILVQVKTAVHPEEPADLSADELRNIRSRAADARRTAYMAKVTINASGGLVRDIRWTRL